MLLLLLLLADLSGVYTGTATIERPDGPRHRQTTVVIRQTGDALTVTIGRDISEQHPVSNVKLGGEKLRFDVIPPGQVSAAMKFDLKVEAGSLTGTHTVFPPTGEPRTGKVELKKQ